MKLFKNLTKGIAPVLISLMAVALIGGARVNAIPYSGDSTPSSPVPAFNVYTGVPSEGNESDFFRGKVTGDPNASVNDVRSTCETGKRFTLRVYVHNGASQNHNGANSDGPSVAKDSKVSVNLNNAGAKTNFAPNATISSSNAGAKTDGMTITCTDGKQVTLSYVNGTASQYSRAGTKPLSDSIVTAAGAPIGTDGPNGLVLGCWEQRVYVTLVVEVKEVPREVPSSAICILDNSAFRIANKTVTIKVDAQLQNATKTGRYEINWGDGTVTNTQTATHTFNPPADREITYTIQAKVEVRLANGSVQWLNGDSCKQMITFKPGQPPIVPPTNPPVSVTPPATGKLASTGPGGIFGIFAATSFVGAAFHKLYLARKATQL